MKNIIITLLLCLIAVPAIALPTLDHLDLEVTMAPPHNEPVVGDMVARYRGQLSADIRWGRVQWEPKLTAWGVNQWQSTAVIGNGSDAWGNSDYTIDEYRISHTQNLSIWITDHAALTTEYYMPLDRKSWGGHGLERHYYWLVGFKLRLK